MVRPKHIVVRLVLKRLCIYVTFIQNSISVALRLVFLINVALSLKVAFVRGEPVFRLLLVFRVVSLLHG